MTVPWYSGAVKRAIPEADSQGFITPRLAILHTNGGPNSSPSLYNYYARGDVGGEAHFQVARSGVGEQYMPVNRRADTNSAANSFELGGVRYGAVSFETEDLGWGAGDPGGACPWTDAQLEFLAGALIWLNVEWGIPAVIVPAWNGAGIGIHRMFPEWTTNPARQYPYKQCPGDAKAAQFPELVAEVQRRLAPPEPVPPPEGDEMLVYIEVPDAPTRFIGSFSHVPGKGPVVWTCEWVHGERHEIYRDNLTHFSMTRAQFAGTTLLGAMPSHEGWDRADFAEWIPAATDAA